MTRVETGSRLHFGLFNLGAGPRRFGGAGLMIEAAGTIVTVRAASHWSARGPLAERALGFAQRLTAEPREIVVEQAAPEHFGLGAGTQLALAVGRAICPEMQVTDLACRLGRGLRSAVGIHGFDQGGFILEAGKEADEISPLEQRLEFPADWRIVLVLPNWAKGLHGGAELRAFEQLQTGSESDYLARLARHILVPALAEADLPTFGEALFEFNRRVGERFAPVQGGPYAHPRLAELVECLRRQGIQGVGQSSWGPAVFAVVEADRGQALLRLLRAEFGLSVTEALVTQARNRGATLE